MREPHDVCSPFTQMLSLTATGTPARRRSGLAPIPSARLNAPFRSISRNAFNESFNSSAASTADSTVARADTLRTMRSVNSFVDLDGMEMESAQNFWHSKMPGGRIGSLIQRHLLPERGLDFVVTVGARRFAFRRQADEG